MVSLWKEGYRAPTISKLLHSEGIIASRRGIHKFLKLFAARRTTARRPGSGRPFTLTGQIKQEVERVMQEDDETTATQLHQMLIQRGYNVSICTVLRCRTALGWTFRGSAYCQIIREANKQKRLDWARQHLHEREDGFQDVIWTDECTVQLETHRRFCCRKRGQPPRNKPRYSTCIACVFLLLLPSACS